MRIPHVASRAPRRTWSAALALATALLGVGCNAERKQECDKFLSVIKPLGQGSPSADTVNRVAGQVGALGLQDQPLQVYAKNYGATLNVLSNTLKLKASASPPDGTEDVIKQQLRTARTDADDVARYCAQ